MLESNETELERRLAEGIADAQLSGDYSKLKQLADEDRLRANRSDGSQGRVEVIGSMPGVPPRFYVGNAEENWKKHPLLSMISEILSVQ